MAEKLTRNTSTPKLAKWWRSVEAGARKAPQYDPRTGRYQSAEDLQIRIKLHTLTERTAKLRKLQKQQARLVELLHWTNGVLTAAIDGDAILNNKCHKKFTALRIRIDRELERMAFGGA